VQLICALPPGKLLRFSRIMRLDLSADAIAALEERTEGWIAGLQLAALSMQGHQDVSGLIRAFAGDHRYIVDYLIDEVLQRQLCRSSLYAFEGGAARSGSSAASARERVVQAAWLGANAIPHAFWRCLGYQFHPHHGQHALAQFAFLHVLRYCPAAISHWYTEHWYARTQGVKEKANGLHSRDLAAETAADERCSRDRGQSPRKTVTIARVAKGAG
jgi:hypothetical protein